MKAQALFHRTNPDDPWQIYIEPEVITEASGKFCNIDEIEKYINITFSEIGFKTTSQLGYFHAEVLPKLEIALKGAGWEIFNENQAKDWLKLKCHYFDEFSKGKHKYQSVKSFSKAKIKEMAGFIDQAIRTCNFLGVQVEDPDEYKKRKGIKQWTK
jgi:hypothetical protein